MAQNVTQCCHVCKSQTTSGPPVFKYLYNLVGFYVIHGTWNIPEHSGTFRNIPEQPGTSNNYDNHEKKMCTIKFWACSRDRLERSDWSRDMLLCFEMNPYGGTLHSGKSIEKYLRSLIIDDILSGGENVSTEY